MNTDLSVFVRVLPWLATPRLELVPRFETRRAPAVRFTRLCALLVRVENQRRDREPPTLAVDRDERQIRDARHAPQARQDLLREDLDLHLERRRPRRRHAGLQDDQIAHL